MSFSWEIMEKVLNIPEKTKVNGLIFKGVFSSIEIIVFSWIITLGNYNSENKFGVFHCFRYKKKKHPK